MALEAILALTVTLACLLTMVSTRIAPDLVLVAGLTVLHFQDIRSLLQVLERLRNQGNTATGIEYNLNLIKIADWIVDQASEGGAGCGQLVAPGTPEAVADSDTLWRYTPSH